MDVRCERCKTEYEFDDSRITEAGVTVKCTTCDHVFKVKKKALVFTVPVKPEEAAVAAPPPPAPAAPPQREWKVRQASGNVFTFKELTTLQKWIVERKVTRDDEISLTGESWKRLGNIAELASFFQVVDEAQKASQLAALQSLASSGAISAAPPQPPPAAPPPAQLAPPPPVAQPQVRAPPPARTPPPSFDDEDDLEAAALKKKGGAGKWLVVLVLVAAAGAGGYYAYFHEYLPAKLAREDKARAETERLVREAEERTRAEAEEKARAEAERKMKEEQERAAKAALADAGPAVVVAAATGAIDAGTKLAKAEPVRDFDGWMAHGDRMRERDRPQAALDAYGKALDLKPDRAEPHAGKGMALLDLGQFHASEASFQQALKLNGRYGVAIIGMAEMYRAQGKTAQAIQYYQKYLEVLPNGPEAAVARNAIERLKQ